MIRAQTKQNQRRTKRVIAKVKQEVRIRVVYQSEGGWADPHPSFFKPALPCMHVNECVKQALSSWLHTLTEHILDYQLSPTQNTSCKLTKERQTHRAELWLPFRLMFGKKTSTSALEQKVNFLDVFGDTSAVGLCRSVTGSAADSGLGLD